tara:strand:+ start:2170 stop:3348 length:1179 start_codon:yes stop_codon:yes gene_type:complete
VKSDKNKEINNEYLLEKSDTKTDEINDIIFEKKIIILISKSTNKDFANQLLNVLELAIFNKNLKEIKFEIKYFDNNNDLKNTIFKTKNKGRIYLGPIDSEFTKTVSDFCDQDVIFFSFSANPSLAKDCVYLINFFPKNELEELFKYLNKDSKVALLYPENNYGYMINSLIDNVANESRAIIVNRSGYKNDLSNVRDAIKELGKYELRKYELDRQKKLLSTKNDNKSKQRLKKLEKFKTTTDYDFTHILIADYGLNLLQVAPLLPFYDIDPNIVQFMATGVIDDENFFFEPSLQGAIFPGIHKKNRQDLINKYRDLYNEKLMRVSTLPYDLVGLLNYIFSKKLTLQQLNELLDNSSIKFEGVDGEFNFKNNIIERDLQILKISNGVAAPINFN